MINSKQAKWFCCEPIENIEGYAEAVADETKMWDCHHRGEVLPCGVYSRQTLKKFGLYYNRPASELIFVTRSQHAKIHREQRSKAGKNGTKNQPREAKALGGKIGGKKMLGKLWWNDGTHCRRSPECPGPGWVLGCLKRS